MTFQHEIPQTVRLARYGTALPSGKVQCSLCPHSCVLGDREIGLCRVRANRTGTLVTHAYGRIVTPPAKDKIEAKPFYHFSPGAPVTTVGGVGCTMACPYCYNWPLVRYRPRTSFLPIESLRDTALSHGSRIVVFAYNEPSVSAEYLLDASSVLHEAGLSVAAASNGFIDRQAREDLLGGLDAVLIDIKDPRGEFYAEVLRGDLEVVWSTVARAHERIHVEVKWVVLPTESPVASAGRIAKRLAGIDPGIPLHIWRYYPHYQWTAPPTELQVLRACWEEARGYVHYVYAPELGDPAAQNTICPVCGQIAVCRQEKRVHIVGLRDDHTCQTCGSTIPIRIEPRVPASMYRTGGEE